MIRKVILLHAVKFDISDAAQGNRCTLVNEIDRRELLHAVKFDISGTVQGN